MSGVNIPAIMQTSNGHIGEIKSTINHANTKKAIE